MKIVFTAMVFAVLLLVPSLQVAAQSPEMPVPLAVVKDADGKPMAQILGVVSDERLLVLFNFEGDPAIFEANFLTGRFNFESTRKFVWFLSDDCTGPSWVSPRTTIEEVNRLPRSFVITNPDPELGTYRVFGSTSLTPEDIYPESSLNNGTTGCANIQGVNEYSLLPAEEILPNPLEGFHGPKDGYDSTEGMLSMAGGTRLP